MVLVALLVEEMKDSQTTASLDHPQPQYVHVHLSSMMYSISLGILLHLANIML